VCNPRRNALLKEGSKSDKADARKLADLLRTGIVAFPATLVTRILPALIDLSRC
jgi:hypothetical protein